MKIRKLFTTLLISGAAITASAQSYSLRTNLVGLGTLNLNIEASMTLNTKWSFHVPVQYNPFVLKDNKQFRNIMVAPGVRYWFLQSYIGSFIGFYGTGARYSIGNLFGHKYRYEGDAYGLGISFGKAYQIGKKWNMEWEIGAGPTWVAYEKYHSCRCGDLISKEHEWRFLPSRAAVNLIYLF